MKKIKANWVFLTLKPAFAVNLLFPYLTRAHSVSISGSKSLGVFLSFLLYLYFQSDTIKIQSLHTCVFSLCLCQCHLKGLNAMSSFG